MRHDEEAYRDHLKREHSRNGINHNPDGCYYCGSIMHPSDSCTSPERQRYWDRVTGKDDEYVSPDGDFGEDCPFGPPQGSAESVAA